MSEPLPWRRCLLKTADCSNAEMGNKSQKIAILSPVAGKAARRAQLHQGIHGDDTQERERQPELITACLAKNQQETNAE